MYLFSVFLYACVPQLKCDCQATMCEDQLFPSLLCVLEMEVRSSGLAASSLIHPATSAVPSLGSLSQWFSIIFNDQTVAKNFQNFLLESELIMNVVRWICCCLFQCVVYPLIQQWSRDLGTRPTACFLLAHKLRNTKVQIMILRQTVIFEVCLLPVWEHPGSTSGKAMATLCSSVL